MKQRKWFRSILSAALVLSLTAVPALASNYQLNIDFSQGALDSLKEAGEKMALIKTVQPDPNPPAWVFNPELLPYYSDYPYSPNYPYSSYSPYPFRAGTEEDLEPLLTRGEMAFLLHLAAGSPQLSDDENWGYPYPDVPGDSELAMPIYWARLQGLLFGYGDGSFGVDDPVTREQLFTILYRYLNNGQSGFANDEWDYTIPYSDVDEMADFAGEAVSWLELNGVSVGFSDGTLGPKETVTLTDVVDFFSGLAPSEVAPTGNQ